MPSLATIRGPRQWVLGLHSSVGAKYSQVRTILRRPDAAFAGGVSLSGNAPYSFLCRWQHCLQA